MNLEQKAKEYLNKAGFENPEEGFYCMKDFKAGYNKCESDIIEFLTANPKSTVKQVLEHLKGMK